MPRPLIGITSYVEPARFRVWETMATLLPHAYVEHVAAAGGQPVALPPVGDPTSLIDRLDGLIVAGGGDLSPASYGAAPHPSTSNVHDARDAAEIALVRAALDRDLPFLGICRGLQILNTVLGGTLHQHVPDLVGDSRHSPAPGAYNDLPVTVRPDSHLAKVLGMTETTVAHYHHQAIDHLGTGLTPTAWTNDIIEAAELDTPFTLGVQWHPEVRDDPTLFQALVAAASYPRG